MRSLSVLLKFVSAIAVTAIAAAPANMAMAADRDPPKRTIIESLDDPKLARSFPSTDPASPYDFSVTRELLPPVEADGAQMAAAGWETVVAARSLETGSISADSASISWWPFGIALLASTLFIYLRQFHPRLITAFPRLAALPGPSFDTSAVTNLFARIGRLKTGFTRTTSGTHQGADAADPEAENASAQMNALLQQIERVVTQLQDGSPLRDVLNQELRLIHYRIKAATDAARSGQDSSEKSAARFRGLVRELERVRRIADSAAASVIDPRDHLALPQTCSEAYALLGVNPDASPAVLKKLVDALRVTWHPDHARNESDRLLREERIKQINSAWDLIKQPDLHQVH